MQPRNEARLKQVIDTNTSGHSLRGSMRGTANVLGDIVGPAWTEGTWDAELGIAYQGETGPAYYTERGIETADDI